MHNLRQHIAFKLLTVFIIVIFLTPTAVKFIHIFNHHTHKVCNDETSTHIHQVDLDCVFLKFHLSKNFTTSSFEANLFCEKQTLHLIVLNYIFLSDFQQLHFSLRGPPQINLT